MAAPDETLSKKGEEICNINGSEPLSRYIVKDGSLGLINPSLVSLPIIDVSLLPSSLTLPSSKEAQAELHKLKLALTSWGCFQAIGHGISSSFLDKVHEVTRQFFALPVEEKQKYARAAAGFEGYGADPVLSKNQVLDYSNRLFLNLIPEDSRNLKLWPYNPNNFGEILNEYSLRMKFTMDLLLKAMAMCLDLSEDNFLKQFGEKAFMAARFNFYPVCSRPDMVLAAKAHSDGSGVTVLLPDKQVEGLQIFKDELWNKVPIIPHALVVNVGDQMQIISNGIFKSPLHRVTANSERERISLAVFYMPDPEKEIEPDQGLIDQKRPQLYRKLKNYAAINFECFQNGKIALDTVRI